MALLGPILGTNEMKIKQKILIIDTRSENELFLYLSYGFRIENIANLISYSDTIEIGDMHNLRYNDKEFDITMWMGVSIQ